MSDLVGLYAIIGLQFLGLLITTWRCDILSRRIDTVHKRITLNNQINGLKSGAWDPEEVTGDVGSVGERGK